MLIALDLRTIKGAMEVGTSGPGTTIKSRKDLPLKQSILMLQSTTNAELTIMSDTLLLFLTQGMLLMMKQ